MCGICGWLSFSRRASLAPVEAMSDALAHRGPDAQGSWREEAGRIALAHRRLAIMDPHPASDQPMRDAGGRALVFNGEIYGFRELRKTLEEEGWTFHSGGDTEVLFAALCLHGPDALEMLRGQFTFAFWDPAEERLLLVRDRLGIKPLFWTRIGEDLIFASELPALLRHPRVGRSLNAEAVARWLQLGYLGGDSTLLDGVHTLEAGTMLLAGPQGLESRRYYDPLAGFSKTPHISSLEEAAEELELRLRDSIRERLVADVPLGCFLSGGVDSTLVAGAAVAEGVYPDTLTIDFEGGAHESPAAAETAKALGLSHRREVCAWNQLDQRLENWALSTGDPLADPSFLPTSMVAEYASRRWKVALSGDGGDELLSGYPRLRMMPRLEELLRLPRSLRRIPASVLPARRWATKLRAALNTEDPFSAYQVLQGLWPAAEVEELLQGNEIPPAWPASTIRRVEGLNSWRRWRALDVLSFLPGRMLAKVDRASMAAPLEVRVPLLDHRIVDFLLSLPEKMCRDKELFRRVLLRWKLPEPSARKTGFEIPLASWLRGPLREKVEAELFSGNLEARGWNPHMLRSCWDRHQSGREDHAEKLFGLTVLLMWMREFGL